MENHFSTTRNRAPEKIDISRKLVTFMIGSETYAVEALKVQEIIGMMKITEIPNSYHYLKGVINLRGIVVPVVDMRLKFGMTGRDYDFFTVIIIIEVRSCPIGMIVDTVSDVIDLKEDDIKDSHDFAASIKSEFISGIGNYNDALIIILDTDKVMTSTELSALEMATAD